MQDSLEGWSKEKCLKFSFKDVYWTSFSDVEQQSVPQLWSVVYKSSFKLPILKAFTHVFLD